MENFWDSSVWGLVNLVAVLLLSLLVAYIIKKSIPFLKNALLPTSVFGGIILLIISAVYTKVTGKLFFDTSFFGGNGVNALEIITYHALALGFIAQSLKTTDKKMTKKRANEIFNTGVTTVSTYLLQAVCGLALTLIIATYILPEFFEAAGILLPFGYGQGSGQALNYGNIYENDYGFIGGRSFGLSVAALGFLSASIGGIIYLNILKKKGKFKRGSLTNEALTLDQIQDKDEVHFTGSIDKLTVQIALVAVAYGFTYCAMMLLGKLLPNMRSVIFGFNFLFGVLFATILKVTLNGLKRKKMVKRRYTNNFLLTRISNTCFDIMIVAGIAAIRIDIIKQYWAILLVLGVVGLVITYLYNIIVAKTLFKDYHEEQFLAMYGMLTGTASTGIMLLREKDPDFQTPVADNLVYQNFPAIVFGFPMMLLATLAPKEPTLTLVILLGFFLVMNLILFRSLIFRKKRFSDIESKEKTEN